MKLKALSFVLVLLSLFIIACSSSSKYSKHQIDIAQATMRVGEDHYRNGKYTLALKNFVGAEKTLYDDPYLQNLLGLTYLAKNRPDLAEPHFKNALNLKPNYIAAKNNLGAIYIKLKKWNQAIKIFEEVAANLLYQTPEMPLCNLGWAYYHQNKFNRALHYFKESLEIRPYFINAVHGIASVYLKQKSYDKAIKLLKQTLGKHPGAPVINNDLAKVYFRLGNHRAAKSLWKLVRDSVPDNHPLAKEATQHLSRY